MASDDEVRAFNGVRDERDAALAALAEAQREAERLRGRIHEAVDECQRRHAQYVSRCAQFDSWSAWAREQFEKAADPVNGHNYWHMTSEANRLLILSWLEERDAARADAERYHRESRDSAEMHGRAIRERDEARNTFTADRMTDLEEKLAATEATRKAAVGELLAKVDLQAWDDLEAERDAARADAERMRPVRDALRGWYRVAPTTSATDSALMAAWEEHCEATGECYTCARPRCPECKLCPLCAGDGHDEACSREGDEYAAETQEGTDGD